VIAVGSIRKSAAIGLTAVCVLLASLVTAASASAEGGPVWKVMSISDPTNFKPGDTRDKFVIMAVNVGSESTDGSAVEITDLLPPGLTASSVNGFDVYRSGSFLGPKNVRP
jgi:hypothetical protein